MCRIIVSLLYVKVLISSHYATNGYRKLKLSFFTAFPHLLTPVSVLIYMTPIWFRNCSIPAISARISNLKKVKICTHMYLINCKFYFCICMLNKNNYMFVMHISNRRGSRNFRQGGGGSNLPKKFWRAKKKSDKMRDGGRFSICSALVWLKFNLAIELLSRQ